VTSADNVRLLLAVATDAFENDFFAMKGGTALILFLQDIPQLSVEIDVVYVPWRTPRDQALTEITEELDAIAKRLDGPGLRTRKIAANGMGDTQLLVETEDEQVKIEVNTVFRGTVLPAERRANLVKFRDNRPADFERQAESLAGQLRCKGLAGRRANGKT
jgi:hypothetical protein